MYSSYFIPVNLSIVYISKVPQNILLFNLEGTRDSKEHGFRFSFTLVNSLDVMGTLIFMIK